MQRSGAPRSGSKFEIRTRARGWLTKPAQTMRQYHVPAIKLALVPGLVEVGGAAGGGFGPFSERIVPPRALQRLSSCVLHARGSRTVAAFCQACLIHLPLLCLPPVTI